MSQSHGNGAAERADQYFCAVCILDGVRRVRALPCGNEPIEARERWRPSQNLATIWLHLDDTASPSSSSPDCARGGDGFLTTTLHADALPTVEDATRLAARPRLVHPTELLCDHHG